MEPRRPDCIAADNKNLDLTLEHLRDTMEEIQAIRDWKEEGPLLRERAAALEIQARALYMGVRDIVHRNSIPTDKELAWIKTLTPTPLEPPGS